jgi:pilus assembly protein CpaF
MTFEIISEESYQTVWKEMAASFDDPEVDELLINGTRSATLIKGIANHHQSSLFSSADDMIRWLQEFSIRRQTRLDPLCGHAGGFLADQSLGGGFRWHCMLPPLTQDGPLFSLRRHRFSSVGLQSFRASKEAHEKLRKHFQERLPLLIAGATGSGKTSLLAALLQEQALQERVFTIESLPELPLSSPFWVRLVERRASLEGAGAVDMGRLLHESLRLRPDRLIIGEIRSTEARAFIEALLTGHSGMAATIHAGNAKEAVSRLAQLADRHAKDSERWLFEVCKSAKLAVVTLQRSAPPQIKSIEYLDET